jgi:hypothetical protein
VKRFAIDYANISGWLLSRIRSQLRSALAIAEDLADEEQRRKMLEVALRLLEAALHAASIDVRVRTTYSIAQIAVLLSKFKNTFPTDLWDTVENILGGELSAIVRSLVAAEEPQLAERDSVELYNLLICGAHFVGSDFLRSPASKRAIEILLDTKSLSYFRFITLRFCFLKDPAGFAAQLLLVNEMAEKRIRGFSKEDIWKDAEAFLLLVDFLSAQDIAANIRRDLFSDMVGGAISNAKVIGLASIIGHTDWHGLSVEHLLARKQLRPVYAWG